MEAEPRILEFTGEDLARVSHAYGTNGIITEIEMPLAPAYDWVEFALGFDDFMDAATFAYEPGPAGRHSGQADHAHRSADPIQVLQAFSRAMCARIRACFIVLVAPHSLDGFHRLYGPQGQSGGDLPLRCVHLRAHARPSGRIHLEPHHVAGAAGRPTVTYLQVRYGGPDPLAKVAKVRETFGAEVLQHLEGMREGGKVIYAGLPIVDFTTEERLERDRAHPRRPGLHDLQPAPLHAGGRRPPEDR
jgi:hypothetical protein